MTVNDSMAGWDASRRPQAHHCVHTPPAHPGTELGLAAAQAGKLADNRETQAAEEAIASQIGEVGQ